MNLPARSTLSLLLMLFLMSLSITAFADVITLKDGRRLEGKILESTEDRIRIEMVLGGASAEMWISRKDIASVEKGNTPQEEFAARLAALGKADLEAHRALIAWCREKGLSKEANLLSKRTGAVEIEARKVAHPARWCRLCAADGISDCASCQGKGEMGEVCSSCTGSGGAKCKTCIGKEGSLLSCRRCAGNGKYEKFDPQKGRKVKVSCSDCRGKGKIICPTCNGKKQRACKTCSGKGQTFVPCGQCLGKKRLKCEGCSGSGLREKPLTPEELAKEALEKKDKPQEESAEAKEKEKKEADAKKKKPVIEIDPFG